MAKQEWECPTCGDVFDSENGMKVHHTKLHGESIAGAEYDCDYCGTTYREMKSEIEAYERNFCSQDCYDKYKSDEIRGESHPDYDRVQLECDYCGEITEKRPCELEGQDHHFCGQECYTEWSKKTFAESENTVLVTCETCGAEFYKTRPHARRTDDHFCDYDCFGTFWEDKSAGSDNPRWKGGSIRNYGESWDEAREAALKRDSWLCRSCGRCSDEIENQIEVHHITALREFVHDDGTDFESAHDLDNLVTLCKMCHQQVEWGACLFPARPAGGV